MARRDEQEQDAQPMVNLTFEQLKELLAEAKGTTLDVAEIAKAVAEGTAKAQIPEDKNPPRISAFNPLGERDHPRPKLKCWFYFGSAPIGSPKENHTLTRAEIDALNGMTPGHFRITKMDQSTVVVEVRGQVDANRNIERLWLVLPEGDDQKNLYPPLADFAAQCSEANRVQPVLAA
jgi:hypothetical protein